MYKSALIKVYRETQDGTYFHVLIPKESLTDEVRKYNINGIMKGELRIDDGRHISSEQRKKIYATLADISEYSGHEPEEIKEIMKYIYIGKSGDRYFSLSSCSMTTARHFINHILDFALEWDMPLMDTLLNRTDDINSAIYASIKHKKCIICGRDGEIHHWNAVAWGVTE